MNTKQKLQLMIDITSISDVCKITGLSRQSIYNILTRPLSKKMPTAYKIVDLAWTRCKMQKICEYEAEIASRDKHLFTKSFQDLVNRA